MMSFVKLMLKPRSSLTPVGQVELVKSTRSPSAHRSWLSGSDASLHGRAQSWNAVMQLTKSDGCLNPGRCIISRSLTVPVVSSPLIIHHTMQAICNFAIN